MDIDEDLEILSFHLTIGNAQSGLENLEEKKKNEAENALFAGCYWVANIGDALLFGDLKETIANTR